MSGLCRYVFGEVVIFSEHVRRSLVIVVTCSARSTYCWDVYDEDGCVPEFVRRGRLSVGTFSAKSC